MPWFPEFSQALEMARRQTRAAARVDPVGEYVAALNNRDSRALKVAWPGEVVIHDPREGEVRGHRHVRDFVRHSGQWLGERHARTETVASTVADGRAVVELLAHLTLEGRDLAWPVTVVAESPDEVSVVFRSYYSQWPHRSPQGQIAPPATRTGPSR
ncbi:MAG: hypothetical protein QOH50_4166 [Kribbellaceae bacterium]|nr:hypothetical protein [Actinomycetota bacterium]MDX6295091.1 hypothetical protein [Kribbellaceae bacterium]